jgi:hypothetical protein
MGNFIEGAGFILLYAVFFVAPIVIAYTRILDGNPFKKPIVIFSYIAVFGWAIFIGIFVDIAINIHIKSYAALYGFIACYAHYSLLKKMKAKKVIK